MDREKLSERFLRIHFIDNYVLLVDVNDTWEEILNQKEKDSKN
jgi:hypothetical protein